MSENKIDFKSSLERLSKSWGFGPKPKTKMPNGENAENERAEDQLIYTQMIMGSLAAMIWGEKAVTRDDKVKTLLGHKDNIYDLIKSIKKTINEGVNNGKTSINLTNNTVNKLDALLTENIKNLHEKLNENLSKAFESIASNQNNIKKLYEELNKLTNSDNTKSNKKNNNNKKVELIIKSDNLNIKEVFESLKGVIKELGDFTLLNSKIGSGFDSYLSLINLNADKFDVFNSKLKENIECLENFFTVLKTYKENSGDVIYLDVKHKSLSDTINKLKDEISVVFNKELVETIINNINDNFKSNPIEINIDTELANKIKEFIDSLAIDPEKLNQTQLAVESLGNILESLNSSLSSNVKKINNNLTNLNDVFDNISGGFTKLSGINIASKDLDQIQLAVESLGNILESLSSSLSFDPKKIENNLTDLNGLFTDTSNGPISGNFGKLFINISKILDDKNIKAVSKDITSLNSVLQTIISVISLESSNGIKLNGLRTLLRITNDKTGIIYKLLVNLSKLTSGENAASINNKNFIAIRDFFDAMSEIGNIGLYKRALIKYNIRYFINFIGSEIPKLINEVEKSSKKTISNETVKSIAAILNIFESLSKIGELEFNHKIRMKRNLMFIRHFILNDIANVLNDMIKSIDSESEKSSAVIESFNHLLDKIFEIGDISFTKFIKLSLKLDLLETILESQVIGEGGILNLISNIKNIQRASDNLSELGSIFDIFNNLVDSSLPLKDIILFSFKVATIESFINITKGIIKNLSNITINNDILQKLDEVKNVFDKTKTITDLISSTKISIKNALLLWLLTKIEQQIIKDASQLINVLNGIQYDKNKVKNIIDLIKSLSEIKGNITSVLLYKKTLNIILGSVDLIKDICKKIKNDIKKNDIENAKKVLGSFNNFIFKAAGILLMGSIIIGLINWENLLAFTAALSGFLFVLSKTFKDIATSLKEDIKTADEIIKLIAASGLILLLGSAIMNDIEILDLLLFTAVLSGFLFVLSKTLENIAKSLKEDINTANEIIKLIAASGLILLFGSAITKLIEPQNLIIFTACLGGFLGGIIYIVNKLNKDISESVKTLREAMIIVGMGAAILIAGSLAATQFNYKNVITFILGLGAILGGIYLIFKFYNGKTLNTTYDSIKKALLIVGGAALILIAGSLAATQFNYKNVITFILGLGAILGGIIYIVNKLNKDISESAKTLRDAMIIVGMSATILIAVSLAASQFKYENIISFILGLGAILGGIYLIFKFYNGKTLNVTYDSIKKALLIVGGAALILMGASLATSQFKYENIISFILGLGAILGGIYLIFKFYNGKTLNVTYDSIKKALLIVGGAALILIAGSLASKYYSFAGAMGFVLELGSFLIALGVLFWGVGKMFNGGIKKARTLVNVVIASSLIMIMGQLLYDYLDTFKIFGFVLILSGFTIALATVFWVAGKLMKKAFIGIALMVLVTAAAGTILLLAGKIVSDNPDILKNALYFAGLLAGYVAVMGLICGLLGTFMGNILLGALAMAGIMAVTLLAIGVMYIMHKVASQPNFYDTIIDGLKAMGWVFGSFIAVIVALGVAVTGPQLLLLSAGAAALAVLEGLVWAAAKVLSAIAISVKQLQSVNVSKEGFKQMKDIIINFASLVVTLIDEFPSNPLKLAKLGVIVPIVKQMSMAVGSMAKGIKEFSDLKIPTAFDVSGNATDWTTIGKSDFKNAQENIGKTLTCIVNAILDVAKTHPDLFKPGIFKDSKAMNAAKVARKMGEAVGSIAKGIKEIASLKVASKYDANGKPIEWVTLGQEDFNKVSVNLGTVLTCINNALLDVAKQYPELFNDHLFKDSPAMNAAKVAKKMGEAVGSIAKGVKEFANLRIVSKYDSKGNPIEYQSLVGKDFDTAKTNIGNVITCISDGLLKVAKENPELFDDHLFTDSPAMNATKVAKKMGEAIGVIAVGIKDWADLKIATKFDSTGKAIEYKSLVDDDFETAGEKIQKVLTCIGNALVSTVAGHKELFDDGLSGDSPALQAAKAMAYMGTTLAITATAISAYSSGKIPVYDKDGKLLPESQWLKMDLKDMAKGEASKTYKAIHTVLTCLGRSLVNIVKDPNNKEIFDTGFFGGDSPAMQASKSIKMIGDTLTNVINVITKLSNMKTEDLTSKLEGIQKNIGSSLNAILNIFQLFANKKKGIAEESVNGGYKGLINAISGGDTIKTNGSIVEYINNHIDDINKATDAIDDMEDSVSKLINTLKSISNEYETSKKELSLFAAGINSPIYKNLDTSLKMIKSLITSLVNEELLDLLDDIEDEDSDIIDGLTSIHNICKFILNSQAALGIQYNKAGKYMLNMYGFINKFTPSIKKLISSLIDKNMLDLFDELDDNYRDIFRGINQTSSIYNMLMMQMTTMQSLYEAVSQFNIEDLIPLVSQFNNCIEALHSIGKTNEENIGNGLNSMFSSFNASEVSKTIKEYSSALDLILAINERSKEAGEEGYNVLRDGILKLYSTTQEIENNGLFKQHADTLNKYIQTINSVELGKLSMMKGFVDAMNQLSARLGNLDKLTDAIANKLSAVLYELVNQLTKADTSINNAHQLQEKRKKLIEESVSKIENLMSQHMIVEISQQTQDTEDMTSQPQGTINGRSIDDNIGHGTEVENSTDNTKLSSPEETNVKSNKGRQQTVSNNALTKEEFDAAMRDHWVNAIAKAIKK